ncbi:protein GrpE [Lachnospiraceae bacterium]|nr:protein GrpE [Lachnospiraceae bacterium]
MVVEEKELDKGLDEEIKNEVDSEELNSDSTVSEESESEIVESEEAPEEDATSEAETTKKKSFFGREKKEKTNKLQEKIEELEDRVKRQMAEFENFRKRSEKEKSAMFETGAKSVVEKILPVVDNFERGLSGLSEEEQKQPFAEGMNMIYKQLITELEKLEVKPIEAVGCEFNPEFHNAVMQVESEEYESGIIAQELQKGYTYRDSVVRHSMVAVVQ